MAFAEQDANSQIKSFASNVFDDQDSQSAGIMKYVESKIAEAFHKHTCDCPVSSPVKVTAAARFDFDGGDYRTKNSDGRHTSASNNILHGRRRIDPFLLKDTSTTSHTQMGIIDIYLVIILLSAFSGPKTCFLAVWKFCIALVAYRGASQPLGVKVDLQADILLAPALYVAIRLQNIICDAIGEYDNYIVYFGSRIVRDSLVKAGAVSHKEE